MFILGLRLKTTKYDNDVINKRFGITGHVHNTIAKHALSLLEDLTQDEDYIKLKKQYKNLKETLEEEEFETASRSVTKDMNTIIHSYGLTKNDLEKYAKVQARLFRKNLSSQQIQKEADRVYTGVEKVLYGDGKKLHLKKYKDINTISSKSPMNGVKLYSPFHKNYLNKKELRSVKYETQINWNGLAIRVDADYSDRYVYEAMQHEVSYCEIKRMLFMDGYHYYVIIYFKGEAPKKLTPGTSDIEIDPGVSTLAVYSEEKLLLEELAPKAKDYQKQIRKLQTQVDNCKRRLNPENYNPDGTVKKGRHKWILSQTAKKKARQITVLYRREAAYRKDSHNALCNKVIQMGVNVRSEPMNFKALQKRAKNTEREDKETVVRKKDGPDKVIHKYKRKKRFGSSCRTRAPAALLVSLKNKCLQYGGAFSLIDTRAVKPSQRDHVSNKFVKTDKRIKIIDGHIVQRDLYAAFIGYCVKLDGKTFDKEKADLLFENYLKMQDALIAEMKAQGISMPQCFGF